MLAERSGAGALSSDSPSLWLRVVWGRGGGNAAPLTLLVAPGCDGASSRGGWARSQQCLQWGAALELRLRLQASSAGPGRYGARHPQQASALQPRGKLRVVRNR